MKKERCRIGVELKSDIYQKMLDHINSHNQNNPHKINITDVINISLHRYLSGVKDANT